MVKVGIGTKNNKKFLYELNNLTRHAAILGTTGSGKTVMGKVLMEEALQRNIPVIAIDPKGDIAGLGVSEENFDFRPFLTKQSAEKTAKKYLEAHQESIKIDLNPKIYTPKSNAGVQISLLPDLKAPKKFNTLSEDYHIISEFVEPISQSIVQLAGINGAAREKAQSLISTILIHNWREEKDLDIAKLIDQVKKPPFEEIGSLPLNEFLNEKNRAKIAGQLNVILTSPAKKALQQGEKVDIEQMFKPGRLSVFDMRFAGTEERQMVVEHILQEIYKFLIRKGGSEKLRYILYIDELAGIMPAPPAAPPAKKLLELLIRQARAFGLGIIVATQNPGDVDYRIFGNIGTRFIGKLRTQNDIEKVATAMDLAPSVLKSDIATLNTGEFVFNNAIDSKHSIIQARWLITLHTGPLKAEQIAWVNNPLSRPAIGGKLNVTAEKERKTENKRVQIEQLIKQKNKKPSAAVKVTSAKSFSKRKKDNLNPIIKQTKKYADKTQVKIALSETNTFTPHLKIVVEPKELDGVELEIQGPYIFDLTSKLIPMGDYLGNMNWSSYVSKDLEVEAYKRSIKQAFEYSVKDARAKIKKQVYQSTILNVQSNDRDEVEQKNHVFITNEIDLKARQLNNEKAKKKRVLDEKIKKNKDKISSYRLRFGRKKAARIIKRIVKKNVKSTTAEMRGTEKKIDKLKKDNKRLEEKKKNLDKSYENKIRVMRDKAYQKAHTCVRKYIYKPKDKDIVVHATILLVPKRTSER